MVGQAMVSRAAATRIVGVEQAQRLQVSSATIAFAGVVLIALVAPFETTQPLVHLPSQSVSNLEAALLLSFGAWAIAMLASRTLPDWRAPLTAPWIALVASMAVAACLSPVSRLNALHMTGRLAAAFGVYLLTVTGVTMRTRRRTLLELVLVTGVVVSVLAILEYLQVPPVLRLLTAFRPGLATVGAQVRAGGSLQYPTITSMYLEIVFAFGLGLLLVELEAGRRATASAVFVALALIADAITLTFTRAGLITMAVSLAIVGVTRHRRKGPDAGVAAITALAVVIGALVLASRSTQSLWLRFTSEGQESWYRVAVDAPPEIAIPSGGTTSIPVTLTNTGRLVWDSTAEPPFYFSYHWMASDADRIVAFEGIRTPFEAPVAPGAKASVVARVRAPRPPGAYRLVWDVVQEGRLWFATEPGAVPAISRATITGEPSPSAVDTVPPPRPTIRPGRLQLWRAAARMFLAHPVFGVGPDNFRLSYAGYAGLPAGDPRIHSNNMYLEVLTGGGLVGALAFAWLLWSIHRVANPANLANPANTAIIAALVAIAVHGLVDSFLTFSPTYVLFSLTVGLACAGTREASPTGTRADADRI